MRDENENDLIFAVFGVGLRKQIFEYRDLRQPGNAA